MTEEPYPGWLRFEIKGEKPYFKTPIPRTVIRDRVKLVNYLTKEQANGRMLEVDEGQFSFKRRFGLRTRKSEVTLKDIDIDIGTISSKSDSEEKNRKSSDTVERLTRSGKVVDHRKLLLDACKVIDKLRLSDAYETPENFESLKMRLACSKDLKAMLQVMNSESSMQDAQEMMFSDACLAEICRVKTSKGPLVDFPPSVNENVYCQIVDFALKECPRVLNFVVNMVVRRGEPVLPSHVFKITTLFSSICHVANQDLDALVKLRGLVLQIDGLSNIGLDVMSDLGLSHCARSLSNHRDLLADIGPAVLYNTARAFPYQSILDNCDIQNEHLTIEVIEKENIDTSHLDTTRMPKVS